MGFELFVSFLQYFEFHYINSRRRHIAVSNNEPGARESKIVPGRSKTRAGKRLRRP